MEDDGIFYKDMELCSKCMRHRQWPIYTHCEYEDEEFQTINKAKVLAGDKGIEFSDTHFARLEENGISLFEAREPPRNCPYYTEQTMHNYSIGWFKRLLHRICVRLWKCEIKKHGARANSRRTANYRLPPMYWNERSKL